MTDQPVITTERLTLRPPRVSDVPLLDLYRGDLRVTGQTRDIPHPLPKGASAAAVANAARPDRTEDAWVIDGTPGGLPEVTGVIRLTPLGRGQSELTGWIAPPFWRTGLAREAMAALVAANPHGADRIFAAVFQGEEPAVHLLIEAGFEYLGPAEAYCVARGATLPTFTYSLKL